MTEQVEDAVVVVADARPNERVVEALLACDAALEAGASERWLAVPYLAYARQDRSFEAGEGVSARAVLEAFSSCADAFVTVDVHSSGVLDFFAGAAVQGRAMPEVAAALEDRGIGSVLAPDEGARGLAEAVADRLEVPFDHLVKTRLSGSEVVVEPKALDVAGEAVVIVDDIIATGGTMCKATEQLLEAGAERVLVAATHGVFASGADERLDAAGVEEVVVTDSIPSKRGVVSCASALARGVSMLQEARS